MIFKQTFIPNKKMFWCPPTVYISCISDRMLSYTVDPPSWYRRYLRTYRTYLVLHQLQSIKGEVCLVLNCYTIKFCCFHMNLEPAKCNLAGTDNGKLLFNAVLSDIISLSTWALSGGKSDIPHCQHTNIVIMNLRISFPL